MHSGCSYKRKLSQARVNNKSKVRCSLTPENNSKFTKRFSSHLQRMRVHLGSLRACCVVARILRVMCLSFNYAVEYGSSYMRGNKSPELTI